MKNFISISVMLLFWVNIAAAAVVGDAVDVSIINDSGQALNCYPAKTRSDLKKVYAEAFKGDHYRIVVHNKLNRRVGVVIAVDGRNIISGQRSWLKNTERMYILDANSVNEYSGWRTGPDKINRFYFTDVPDSYAAAFGDESAMGVIAVAAYPEVKRMEPPVNYSYPGPERKIREQVKDKAEAPSVQGKASALESAGTGYGRGEYSPSYQVSFAPEKKPVESILIKYEWRKTLCRMNIIHCGRTHEHSFNRMWDNDGFAPPPPGRN